MTRGPSAVRLSDDRRRPARRPGAGKGTQAALLAERLGIPHVATGDLFRAAVRDGSPIGLEARRYMERGQLVPDDITIRMLLDRLAQPDAAERRDPRRLPAQPRPGRGARRGARRARRARSTAPSASRSRPTSWSGACPAAGSAATPATSTTRHQPAPGPGRLRHRRLAARPARRRQGRDDPRPARPAAGQPATTWSTTTRRPASCARSTALQPIDDGRPATLLAAIDAGRATVADGGLTMVTRKSRAEIARMRRAGRIVAEVLALVERELKPGVSTGHLDRARRGPHPRGRRDPVVQGLPGHQPAPAVPGQPVHLARRRDRPRHPRRADDPRGPGRVDRRRRHRRRLARRRGPDLLRRRRRPSRSASSSTPPARR